MSTLQATISTGKDDWRTPAAVLEKFDAEFGFGVDAASSVRPGVSEIFFGPGSPWHLDGLELWPQLPSEVPRVAWINPPYSRRAGRGKGILSWHQRAWEESRRGWTVVVLCPPHPGRGWFHRFAVRADEVRVFRRRLAFIDPSTGLSVKGNTQDSCLVVYRPDVPSEGHEGGPRWSWIDPP